MNFVAGARAPSRKEYDVDVVILSQDRLAETLASIASVQKQEGVRRHLTVLDQGSADDCLATLARSVERRSDASLFAVPRNVGVAAGRNRATAFGHGRIVVGLDNDAILPASTTLATAVKAFDADPAIAAIGFRILLGDTGKDDLLSWGYPKSLLPRAPDRFPAATFVGAGHAIRRAAWNEVGGYDETLFFCWEEWDFCMRAIARSWHIRYCGDIAIHHMVSPERRVRWNGGRWFYFVRNRLYLARKHGRAWGEVLGLAAAYAIKGARNGLAAESLRAIAAALQGTARLQPASHSNELESYLRSHHVAHRARLAGRIRRDLLSRLPG